MSWGLHRTRNSSTTYLICPSQHFSSGLLFLVCSQFLNLLSDPQHWCCLLSRIFKVALLFICQGSNRCFRIVFAVRFATALLDYHKFFDLSTTFFKFFIFFSKVVFILHCLTDSFDRLPQVSPFVNKDFQNNCFVLNTINRHPSPAVSLNR